LEARGVPHRRDVPLGVMVETPAAAVAADTFAGDVAFFSIGTNDLVQYTLAVDRGNVNLASRFTPLHPAVLRLIRRTVQMGAAAGLEVSVCGEMASQPLMAFALIGLGVRQLSVAVQSVAMVKRIIRGISVDVAQAAAEAAMLSPTAEGVESVLRDAARKAFGDAPFLRYGLPVRGEQDMFGDAGDISVHPAKRK
ncbi:MAG TPA: putative PEP-binding protein, partial [Candidatus Elarobacter sp.]|nr:putative PEP-binding protein [Candidatus Elarobacter sp.]